MANEVDYDGFVENLHTNYPLMYSQPYGGVCTGEGWWPIISTLSALIQSHIDSNNKRRETLLADNRHNFEIPDEVSQVIVTQIKEKFGGLRFYYDGGDDYIDGLVAMAETWAGRTCEECGAPGRAREGGWIRTLCDLHEAERQEKMRQRFD